MSGWESLFVIAAGEYNNGNYKDSYNNYLKAANALLYKLSHEVSFANKDIVKTKPHNTSHLFTQLKSCVQRLEDIIQNRAALSSLDLATSIITASPTPQHLPLIPFSPLTRQSLHHAHQLATANQKVSVTKQKGLNNSDNDLSALRKLDEDIRHYKNKLDHVNNQIQSIGEVTLTYWDDNDVAKQLTIIESELYKKVDFKKDSTLKDKSAQACMDFHRYLTNSLTHQFMIHADSSRSSANLPRAHQIITHAVKVACLLLNNRNFNSFAAVMKALTSPEVRRIRRLWANLPTRINQQYKEFSSLIKKEDNDYKAYKEILTQKMEPYRDSGQGIIVIPWMQPHYEEIKSITQSYTSGKSGDNVGFILSEPGQRKLASIFSFLERCQSNVINTDDEEWRSNNINSNRKITSSNPHKTSADTINLFLDCMGNGNLELHHWLVSRVYLTKQQLIDESMVIEPLGENEQPLCVENEYEEEEGEESDLNSVGRYDIGSEDGGDNIEAGTSSNHEATDGRGAGAKNSVIPFKLEEHNISLLSSKTSLMSKHERNESVSKSIINGTSSTSVSRETSKSEEPQVNVEVIENDSMDTNSSIKPYNVENTTISNFAGFSRSEAIPIPVPASQKAYQPSMSPASMLTNLNPNAEPFIPRFSLSSSAPGPTSDARNNINVSIKDLTEMGKSISNTNADDDDDENFVYPTSSNENADDDDDDDDGGNFVYPADTTSNNGLNENTDDDDLVFIYNDSNKEEKSTSTDSKESQDDNDDGEGTSFVYTGNDNNNSEYNNNTNINKNGMNGVSTKVDKSSSDSITVKMSELEGSTKV